MRLLHLAQLLLVRGQQLGLRGVQRRVSMVNSLDSMRKHPVDPLEVRMARKDTGGPAVTECRSALD